MVNLWCTLAKLRWLLNLISKCGPQNHHHFCTIYLAVNQSRFTVVCMRPSSTNCKKLNLKLTQSGHVLHQSGSCSHVACVSLHGTLCRIAHWWTFFTIGSQYTSLQGWKGWISHTCFCLTKKKLEKKWQVISYKEDMLCHFGVKSLTLMIMHVTSLKAYNEACFLHKTFTL